jgi:transcription elongation factor
MCHCAKQKIAVCHHHVINHFCLLFQKKIKTGNGVYISRRRKVASVMGRKTKSSIGLGEKINAQYRINS